ncbi:MAG: PHP domain-containing protein [Deltaproteobacteria bacterium]|nr:PHP domain-containing protein [Deltaproteobacteria bacterium]MBW2136098.1 PHP domain-containing protein [Deltaproteobacteria bacterium]
MKIDLHIHSTCSDGRMTPEEIFITAKERDIEVISITDHDSLDCQEAAGVLSREFAVGYIFGLELNVSFSHPGYRRGKPISLDFLAYDYGITYGPLIERLQELREYRKRRAERILRNVNQELAREGLRELTQADLDAIQGSVDGTFGRPHIADYLVKKGVVADRQEAFDRYLVKCNVPKMPLSLEEASHLVKGAGGKLILAHPNHPRGTSLISYTRSLGEQQEIIEDSMLPYIDGIECWHSSQDKETTASYMAFAKRHGLLMTGGSDCHQQPVLMGTVKVPSFVIGQFGSHVADSRAKSKRRKVKASCHQ